MSTERPAFYALSPGGWRDWWTLLHPPYTVWHLSYVAIGAATAPRVDGYLLVLSLLGFFLGVGVAAHALDELRGRPLGTAIPSGVLAAVAMSALAGAAGIGMIGVIRVSPWLLAWGGFPALTGAFAQDGRITWAAIAVAAACVAISGAQRALSTPVRRLRRRVAAVEGRITMRDGTVEPIDAGVVRAAPEAALKLLSLAMPLLAAGLVLARLAP